MRPADRPAPPAEGRVTPAGAPARIALPGGCYWQRYNSDLRPARYEMCLPDGQVVDANTACEAHARAFAAALAQPGAAGGVPAGHVAVPIEPTAEMVEAGDELCPVARGTESHRMSGAAAPEAIWAAMLKAAPPRPAAEPAPEASPGMAAVEASAFDRTRMIELADRISAGLETPNWRPTRDLVEDARNLLRRAASRLDACAVRALAEPAGGVAPLVAAPLTADFVNAFPDGSRDESRYDEVEDALDRAEAASCGENGRWLKLPERIAALAADLDEARDRLVAKDREIAALRRGGGAGVVSAELRRLSEAATPGEATFEVVPFHYPECDDADLPGSLRIGKVEIAMVHEQYGPGAGSRYEEDGALLAELWNDLRARIAAEDRAAGADGMERA